MKTQQNPIDYFPSGKYKFDSSKSLSENYTLFNQAISFKNGVEFLSSSNESTEPIIYLLDVPGLSINIEETREILSDFHFKFKEKLEKYFAIETDLFNLYRNYFSVYDAVEAQQEEFVYGKEIYLGKVTIREFPVKDIKKLNLPIIRSNYRGTFLNSGFGTSSPVLFENLGRGVKAHLGKLYVMKRNYNSKLYKYLCDIKKTLFKRETESRFYRYEGDTTNLVEIAFMLAAEENITNVGGANVRLEFFCKEFCRHFKKNFSSLSDYANRINSRLTTGKLFLNEGKNKVKDVLNSLNI